MEHQIGSIADTDMDGLSVREREMRRQLDEIAEKATPEDAALVADILNVNKPPRPIMLTPGAAAIIVTQHNPLNRAVSQPKINGYVTDMKAGDWQLNHQGMAITPEGALGDGQHRGIACALSGVTIPVMITPNIPISVIHATTDMTKPRTAGQALHMAGVDDGEVMASLVRPFMTYLALANGEKRPYLSNTGIQRAVRAHNTLFGTALKIATETMKGVSETCLGRKEAAVIAAVAMHYGWSEERTEKFLRNVQRGEAEYPEAPTVALARLLQKAKVSGVDKHKMSGTEKIAYCIKAADLWGRRRAVAKLIWKEGKEAYPTLTPDEHGPEDHRQHMAEAA